MEHQKLWIRWRRISRQLAREGASGEKVARGGIAGAARE
jgi:hypothetical protein